MKGPIYLDSNATTPVDPRVLEAMLPYFCEVYGNPSSASHSYGWESSMAVEKARHQVAELLQAENSQIYWTSGATESNNLVILGLWEHLSQGPCHIITSKAEHKAVLEVCQLAEKRGARVSYLAVNGYGQVEPDVLEKALTKDTRLVSIMWANNEVGSLNPIPELVRRVKTFDRKIFFHSDIAQAYGKIPINTKTVDVDFLSISGHKIYGPKGVGALYARPRDLPLTPLFAGGRQEKGFRPGTLNVPGIVGLGSASIIAQNEMQSENQRLTKMRDELIQAVVGKNSTRVCLNGHPQERLSNNLSFSFKGLSADLFALGLSGLAVSSGSACSSGEAQPSYVLKAMGLSDELARSTVRIGLSRFSTPQDLQTATEKILGLIKKNQQVTSQLQGN